MADRIGLIAFFDGACVPNPNGPCGAGAYILGSKEGVEWEYYGVYIPKKGIETSNNLAEYFGLISILEYLLDNSLDRFHVEIYGDSDLVVKQMNKTWKIKKGCYVPAAKYAMTLLTKFRNKPTIRWIPREQNKKADELASVFRKGNAKTIEHPFMRESSEATKPPPIVVGTKHPMQPLVIDENGTVRFKRNEMLRFILDTCKYDLNDMALMPFSDEDRSQISQLCGYSVSGWGGLGYAEDEDVEAADALAAKLLESK